PPTIPASPRAKPSDETSSVSSRLPAVLTPPSPTLSYTLDLINRVWEASETEARPLFPEIDRHSASLGSEENHILATVLETGLTHSEGRRRVVALTALTTLVARVEPERRWNWVEKIFPHLSDPEFEVRAVAKSALTHLGLFLKPTELSQLNRELVDIALESKHPARADALSILTSHYELLPIDDRPPIARAIMDA